MKLYPMLHALGVSLNNLVSIWGCVKMELKAGKHLISGGDSLFMRQSSVFRLYKPEGKCKNSSTVTDLLS
jgi:hypothetical protein